MLVQPFHSSFASPFCSDPSHFMLDQSAALLSSVPPWAPVPCSRQDATTRSPALHLLPCPHFTSLGVFCYKPRANATARCLPAGTSRSRGKGCGAALRRNAERQGGGASSSPNKDQLACRRGAALSGRLQARSPVHTSQPLVAELAQRCRACSTRRRLLHPWAARAKAAASRPAAQ